MILIETGCDGLNAGPESTSPLNPARQRDRTRLTRLRHVYERKIETSGRQDWDLQSHARPGWACGRAVPDRSVPSRAGSRPPGAGDLRRAGHGQDRPVASRHRVRQGLGYQVLMARCAPEEMPIPLVGLTDLVVDHPDEGLLAGDIDPAERGRRLLDLIRELTEGSPRLRGEPRAEVYVWRCPQPRVQVVDWRSR